jgi:hypothetical protein
MSLIDCVYRPWVPQVAQNHAESIGPDRLMCSSGKPEGPETAS